MTSSLPTGSQITLFGTAGPKFDTVVNTLSVYPNITSVTFAQLYSTVPIWTITVEYDRSMIRLATILELVALTGMVITAVTTESP